MMKSAASTAVPAQNQLTTSRLARIPNRVAWYGSASNRPPTGARTRDKMQVAGCQDRRAAIAGQKIVVAVKRVDFHDVPRLGLNDKGFQIHVLSGSFRVGAFVKALFLRSIRKPIRSIQFRHPEFDPSTKVAGERRHLTQRYFGAKRFPNLRLSFSSGLGMLFAHPIMREFT